MSKMTRQGVRDLNSIKAPPKGRKLAPVPAHQLCECKRMSGEDVSGGAHCLDCGEYYDWDGNSR